jgi:hypothetical protein
MRESEFCLLVAAVGSAWILRLRLAYGDSDQNPVLRQGRYHDGKPTKVNLYRDDARPTQPLYGRVVLESK